MRTVNIEGKSYVIGLDWSAYDSLDKAKEVVEDSREDGYVSGIVPLKDRGIYLVYRGEKIRGKHYILATAFLHKASGAYYMSLGGETVWLFVKGVDGGVLYEGELKKEEAIYKALEFNMRELVPLSVQEMQKAILYASPKGKGLYVVLGAVVLFSFVLFLVFSKLTSSGSDQSSLPAPTPAPQPPSHVNQPPPSPPNLPPPAYSFDMRACYRNYYEKLQEVDCKELKPAEGYMSCEELKKHKLPFVYGQTRAYDGGVVAYSFSLNGQFYYTDLKELSNWTFAQEGFSFNLSGEPEQLNLVWTGTVLCRR